MKIRFWTFLIVILCSAAFVQKAEAVSNGTDMTFTSLSANDGLSQNTVLSIGQDRLGNLWFTTFDGLNRYDGYGFTVFRHDDSDSTSIGSNTVRTIFFSEDGTIWAGTAKGLSSYNPRTEKFSNYPTPEGAVTCIEGISGTKLLVGTEAQLRIFDTENGGFVKDGVPEYMAVMEIRTLSRYGDSIYIGTRNNGLFSYSIEKGEYRRVSSFRNTCQINVLLPEEDILWVGTEGEGLFHIDLRTMKVDNWKHNRSASSGTSGICSNYVRSLAYDKDGRLWIGTFNGLSIYDKGRFSTFTSDPFVSGSLSHNSVRSIFMDNQNGMWLGTYFGGLNYWNQLKNSFRHIHRLQKGSSLNDNIISCIVEDRDRSLWIGTNSGGVNHYIPSTGKFSYYPLQSLARPADMESNDIKAIYMDENSAYVYIGAHAGGLNTLDRRTGRIENFEARSYTSPPRDVYAILKKDRRNLWIGTLEGLYTFDMASKTFSREAIDADGNQITPLRIKDIFLDSGGNLWIGGEDGLQIFRTTELGLSLVPLKDDSMKKLAGLAFIQDIFESETHTIWIATRDGLWSFDRSTDALKHYTVADGLPSDIIHGIEEDSHGRLWLSTDFGLSCFNPYSDNFRNFTVMDGLQGNHFNTYAHCRTMDGEMYFGGISGITVFSPEKLEDNPYTPQPIITGLQVFNRTVYPDDGSGILTENISMASGITLKHNQNHFTIEFSVPNYLAGKNNTFSCMLEGFDKEWYTATDTRSVSYSNLPHGKYRFMVKAANNDGKWNNNPTVLEIRVKPQWYQSIAAQIAFVLLALAIIIAVIVFMLERKNMETRLLLEKQESAHQEEISQMKMRFFINISHELRTPLTMIINPLEEMMSKASDIWMRKQLKYMERNAKRLLYLVNQLMDYRRAELGVFRLNVKPENVYRIVWENWSYYENIAKSRKIRYSLFSDIKEDRHPYVDGQYLELILNNLLSNAFKYTDEGSVTVRLTEKDGSLVLSVSDTGIGIPAEEKDRIFERFYQVESKHIGSGIGLSLVQRLVELHHGHISLESEVEKGSTFTVSFPQDLGVYSKEELDGGTKDVHTSNTKNMYILDTDIPDDETPAVQNHIKRGRILIAENNSEIRNYMSNGLSRQFDIMLASNGAEALELLKNNDIDIVISDMEMPEMDGLKLCTAIKRSSETSHIPVIVLSARTDRKDQLEALKNGADDFMVKPFSMAVLVAKLQNMIRTQTRLHDKVTKTMEIVPEKVTFNPVDEDFLKRTMEIIEKNMDNVEFTTDEFAKAMNMSRSNLHLRLKAITGESALQFIHRVRLEKARKLLLDGTYTIAEISDKVGFNSPSYFTTCFKRHMGCNPSEYLQEQNRK